MKLFHILEQRMFEINLKLKRDSSGKYWQVLNLINKLEPVEKILTSAEIKIINFHSGSVQEFPNVS